MLAFFTHPVVTALRRSQFVLALVVFYYAALAPADGPGSIPPLVLHFVGNVLLITSCWLALWRKLSSAKLFIACLFLTIIAEGAQGITATRVADPADLLANVIGLLVGLGLCTAIDRHILGVFTERPGEQNQLGQQ